MYHEVLVDEALLSLCVTDLNSDGLPDLVCGYASGQTLRRCLQVPRAAFHRARSTGKLHNGTDPSLQRGSGYGWSA